LVVKQQGKLISLEVEQKNVVFGMTITVPPKRVECDVEDVVVMEEEHVMEEKTFKGLGAMTVAEKRFVIKAAYVNDPVYVCYAEPGQMLDDASLLVIFEYLQWQYLLPEVTLVKASIVKIALHFGTTAEAGAICLLQIKDADTNSSQVDLENMPA